MPHAWQLAFGGGSSNKMKFDRPVPHPSRPSVDPPSPDRGGRVPSFPDPGKVAPRSGDGWGSPRPHTFFDIMDRYVSTGSEHLDRPVPPTRLDLRSIHPPRSGREGALLPRSGEGGAAKRRAMGITAPAYVLRHNESVRQDRIRASRSACPPHPSRPSVDPPSPERGGRVPSFPDPGKVAPRSGDGWGITASAYALRHDGSVRRDRIRASRSAGPPPVSTFGRSTLPGAGGRVPTFPDPGKVAPRSGDGWGITASAYALRHDGSVRRDRIRASRSAGPPPVSTFGRSTLPGAGGRVPTFPDPGKVAPRSGDGWGITASAYALRHDGSVRRDRIRASRPACPHPSRPSVDPPSPDRGGRVPSFPDPGKVAPRSGDGWGSPRPHTFFDIMDRYVRTGSEHLDRPVPHPSRPSVDPPSPERGGRVPSFPDPGKEAPRSGDGWGSPRPHTFFDMVDRYVRTGSEHLDRPVPHPSRPSVDPPSPERGGRVPSFPDPGKVAPRSGDGWGSPRPHTFFGMMDRYVRTGSEHLDRPVPTRLDLRSIHPPRSGEGGCPPSPIRGRWRREAASDGGRLAQAPARQRCSGTA